MVLKQKKIKSGKPRQFENDVKMYGTQAFKPPILISKGFENDVKMYGTQAEARRNKSEKDV